MNTIHNSNIVDINELTAMMRFGNEDIGQIIETERLILLPSANDRDLQEYHRHLIDEGDFYLQYGFEPDDEILTKCDFESNCVDCYSLFLKSTGEMIGYVGIGIFTHNLEFYIFKDHRSNGYCKEAAGRLISAFFYGELDKAKGDRLVAQTFFTNESAKSVLLALGFKLEGFGFVMEFDENVNDKPNDVIISYALENKEKEYAA